MKLISCLIFLVLTQQAQAQEKSGSISDSKDMIHLNPADLDSFNHLDKSSQCSEDVKKFCAENLSVQKRKECFSELHLNETLSPKCKKYLGDKFGLRKPVAPANKNQKGRASN